MAPIYYIIVAFPCTVGAIALAIFHIYRHLINYTEPTYQRYIVRIIFMVPRVDETEFHLIELLQLMGVASAAAGDGSDSAGQSCRRPLRYRRMMEPAAVVAEAGVAGGSGGGRSCSRSEWRQ
ncbi:hypothetical protein Taro_027698 [Colocasia esculenta]|uniref:Uncharacterized protein n=1 Tax=Colocasia esculenta TaxID=4460 RepID=A0A843VGE9_COLES|nr:hypothetical protein [Colocasia esculenta]